MTELETRQIVNACVLDAARLFGVPAYQITGFLRRKAVSEARQWVYAEAYHRGATMAAIGRAMGRDHTTVMHGINREAERQSSAAPVIFRSIRAVANP